MPIVPRRDESTIAPSPVPGARVPTDIPARALGSPEGVDLSGAHQQLREFVDRERAKADQVAILDADNQLAQLQTDLHTQAVARRGKDALGATADVADGWQKGVSTISQGLTSERQRLAFADRSSSRWQSLYSAVESHAASERVTYDAQQTDTALKNRLDSAMASYNNPQEVAKNAVEARAIVADHGRRNGWSPEVIAQKADEQVSNIHAGVIARFLAVGQDLAAKAYYDKWQGQIEGSQRDNIDRALEEGSTRGESQRQAAAIIAKTSDRGAALAAAAKISDPKVRDLTEQRINQHFSEQQTIQNERQEAAYLAATNIVDKYPGQAPRALISPAHWSQLSLNQREALERRAEAPGTNDDKTWLTFLDLRPTELGVLTKSQFETAYWSKFDKPHREAAASQWAVARDAFRNGKFTDPKLVATQTFKDIVENALVTSQIIDAKAPKRSDDDVRFYASFEDEARKRVEAFGLSELGGKRPATPTEVQQVVDGLLVEKVFQNPDWRGSKKKNLKSITADAAGRPMVPTAVIPRAELNAIGHYLRQRGFTVSTSKVERMYAAHLMFSRPSFDAIAAEP